MLLGVPVLHTESPATFTLHVAQHEPGLAFGVMTALGICDHVSFGLFCGGSGSVKCGGKIERLDI